MKNPLFILVVFFLQIININNVIAQDSSSAEKKVMIIPFNPDYYFSEDDIALAKYNNKQIGQVRNAFRYGMNVNVKASIVSDTDYLGENMLALQEGQEDLKEIYYNLEYFYDIPTVPVIVEDKGSQNTIANAIEKPFKKAQKQAAGDEYTNMGALKPGTHESQYMNVKVANPAMFEYLYSKYGTALFVFINQMEIKNNYEHCLDRNLNDFDREITIHFSIFNANGEHLYGNAVTFVSDNNTRDINEIIKKDFPIIASYVSEQLPKKVRLYQTSTVE